MVCIYQTDHLTADIPFFSCVGNSQPLYSNPYCCWQQHLTNIAVVTIHMVATIAKNSSLILPRTRKSVALVVVAAVVVASMESN